MLADSYYLFKEKAKTDPDTAIKFGGLSVKLADRLERVIQNDQKADDLFSEIKFDIEKDNEIVKVPTADDIGAEVGGKFDDYEVKSKLPKFKDIENINGVAPQKPKSIDDYEG